LENKNTSMVQLDSLSWFCGCIGGSPGEAYFPCYEPIIFSEFNLGKLSITHNAEDWVEIKNNTNLPINFEGYTFKDNKQDHFFTLTNLILAPNEYALIVVDSSLFMQRHPDFDGKALYQLPFGIANDDALRLYDAAGTLLQSVVFNNQTVWPQAPFISDFTFEYLEAGAIKPWLLIGFKGVKVDHPGKPILHVLFYRMVHSPGFTLTLPQMKSTSVLTIH